jgi:hypothetical protein
MCNRLIITRLRITPGVIARLNQLGLSLADLDFILCFARKTPGPGRTVYAFAPEKLPPEAARQLSHLAGWAAIVMAGEVVDIIKETADCEPPGDSDARNGPATPRSTPTEASKKQ